MKNLLRVSFFVLMAISLDLSMAYAQQEGPGEGGVCNECRVKSDDTCPEKYSHRFLNGGRARYFRYGSHLTYECGLCVTHHSTCDDGSDPDEWELDELLGQISAAWRREQTFAEIAPEYIHLLSLDSRTRLLTVATCSKVLATYRLAPNQVAGVQNLLTTEILTD